MIVPLNGKRFVTALVQMTVAHTTTVFLPVAYVRDREFLHEGAQVAIAPGPEEHMPMIRHEAIRDDPHRAGDQRFLDNSLESFEISLLQKQPHPAHASVQDV